MNTQEDKEREAKVAVIMAVPDPEEVRRQELERHEERKARCRDNSEYGSKWISLQLRYHVGLGAKQPPQPRGYTLKELELPEIKEKFKQEHSAEYKAELLKVIEESKTLFEASVVRAIRAGELLINIKEEVGHGHFMEWVTTNIHISQNTAWKYMKLYQVYMSNKGLPLNVGVTEAFKLLPHKPKLRLPKEAPVDESLSEEPQPVLQISAPEKPIEFDVLDGVVEKDDGVYVYLTDRNFNKVLAIVNELETTTVSEWVNNLIEQAGHVNMKEARHLPIRVYPPREGRPAWEQKN